MNAREATWVYADKLAGHADRLGGMVDTSDAAYYESGYFLIYATFKPYRMALNLNHGETTSALYPTELQLQMALVGNRIGVPGRTWPDLPFDYQKQLHALAAEHSLAMYQRQSWYDQFAWSHEPVGPKVLPWEFTEQLARSTGCRLAEEHREQLITVAMVLVASLDPHSFLREIHD